MGVIIGYLIVIYMVADNFSDGKFYSGYLIDFYLFTDYSKLIF